MTASLSRRRLLTATPAAGLALGTVLLDPSPARARVEPEGGEGDGSPLHPAYPTQEAATVREVVSVAHGNLERLRELVDPRPELSRAAWDWGFGDWETALGAASHVGNRAIAEYLIERGARPDLFTAAMLGNLEAVRALIGASPGLERQPGPHGISLFAHARAGGEPALPVLRFLESLGTADPRPTDLPLELERDAYVGTYTSGADVRFEVAVHRNGLLTITGANGTPRNLFHQGGGEFHPSGAPSARIHFLGTGGRIERLEIRNPEPLVKARRTG